MAHGDVLMQAIRAVFNTAIGAESADIKNTARSALLQMINTVLKRVGQQILVRGFVAVGSWCCVSSCCAVGCWVEPESCHMSKFRQPGAGAGRPLPPALATAGRALIGSGRE